MPSSAKKRPIPQPRRTPLGKSSSIRDTSTPSSPSTPSSIKSSLKNLLPSTAQPIPVPGANFVSYTRVPPAPAQTPSRAQAAPAFTRTTPEKPLPPAMPDYINTTPPAVPARNPNTSLSSPSSVAGVRPKVPPPSAAFADNIPLPTSAPPPRPTKPTAATAVPPTKPPHSQPGVVLRSKSSSSFVASPAAADKERRYSGDNSNNRHGLILDQKASIPYYVGDVDSQKATPSRDETTPEKQWIDSLRRREHLEPEDEDVETTHPGLRSAHNYRPLRQESTQQQQLQGQLKYAFDMDLGGGGNPRASGSLQDDFNLLAGSKGQQDQKQQQKLPPLFTPDSYSLQDYSQKRQQQQQQQQQYQK